MTESDLDFNPIISTEPIERSVPSHGHRSHQRTNLRRVPQDLAARLGGGKRRQRLGPPRRRHVSLHTHRHEQELHHAGKLIHINANGEILEGAEGLRPSSEIKMHLRCYEKRPDVWSVIHAHPPGATGFAVAHKAMDMYNMIEDVAVIGSVPLTPYGTPSTAEVPDAIEPYLEEHDVMLLENHGALAVGSDVITAFYRMESLELWAKITINAVILGGSIDISRENIQKLIDLRGFYRVTGRHPGYKKFDNGLR